MNSTIPCYKGGHNCNWPACSADCDGRPGSVISAPAQSVVERATEEACRRFSDEVEQYSQAHIDELASFDVKAHPAGKITVDRGNLRYAFIEGARFAAQPPAAPVETEDAIELVSQIIYQEASISHYGDESEVDNSDYVAREVLRALARKHHSPCSAETGEAK